MEGSSLRCTLQVDTSIVLRRVFCLSIVGPSALGSVYVALHALLSKSGSQRKGFFRLVAVWFRGLATEPRVSPWGLQ